MGRLILEGVLVFLDAGREMRFDVIPDESGAIVKLTCEGVTLAEVVFDLEMVRRESGELTNRLENQVCAMQIKRA
jgi:hypothetical protein